MKVTCEKSKSFVYRGDGRVQKSRENLLMAISDVELTKHLLVDLNKRIGEMEQKQGEEAHLFFDAHLSD